MSGSVLGVDSSTQSTKVEIRDVATGEIRGRASSPHPELATPRNEQDPRSWWSALVDAVGQLPDSVRSDVGAVAVAGQQHGLVVLDAESQPLRASMLWNDTRCALESDQLIEQLGETEWMQSIGSLPVPSFTLPKLVWMAEHEPELFNQIASISLPHDYLTGRLSGQHVTDRGDASGSGWFDPVANRYRLDLLERFVGSLDWSAVLPEVRSHDEPVGVISPAAAQELGLPADVLIGAGTGDNMAGAVGVGLAPGDSVLSVGTSGTVYCRSDQPSKAPHPSIAGFASAIGGFMPLVCTLNATRVTDTVSGWLGIDDHATFAALALEDRRAGGPVLVPWFEGERTPNLPDATGSIRGLTHAVDRGGLARAAHDGVLCGLLEGLDNIRTAGFAADGAIRIVGGGAKGAYPERLADLVGSAVTVPTVEEAVAAGASVLAANLLHAEDCVGIADAWGLSAGAEVEPLATNGAELRAQYGEIVRQVQGLSD